MSNTNRNAVKSFSCNVTYKVTEGSFMTDYTVTIQSPKTGRVLTVGGRAFTKVSGYVMEKVVRACGCKNGSGVALLTANDLRSFLEAQESAREDYKDSMNGVRRHADGRICTSGDEDMDGFCEGCEDELAAKRGGGSFQLHSYEAGL